MVFTNTYIHFYFRVLTHKTIITVCKAGLILRCILKSGDKKKNNQQIGKNSFNFAVDGLNQTHPYEQKPITNDDEFRADVIDTKKMISDANKENIPPQSSTVFQKYPSSSPQVSQRFIYALTMANIKQFDKQFKLPKIKKKKADEKNEERKRLKDNLTKKLAQNDEKMKIINKKR